MKPFKIKLLIILSFLCASATATAAGKLTVRLSEAGTLAEKLEGKLEGITSLELTGPVNASDFYAMWSASYYGDVVSIDLMNAVVDGDSIPSNAFFHGDEQGWWIPGGECSDEIADGNSA